MIFNSMIFNYKIIGGIYFSSYHLLRLRGTVLPPRRTGVTTSSSSIFPEEGTGEGYCGGGIGLYGV